MVGQLFVPLLLRAKAKYWFPIYGTFFFPKLFKGVFTVEVLAMYFDCVPEHGFDESVVSSRDSHEALRVIHIEPGNDIVEKL